MRAIVLSLSLLVFVAGTVSAAPATCSGGRADGFECDRIDLTGRLDLATLGLGRLNDIWGWTDPLDGREYAIVGAVNGTIFVDLADPASPRIVGRLRAHDELLRARVSTCKASTASVTVSALHDEVHDEVCGEGGSSWRDIKVYADHAYIVSEAFGHGMQVFDLRQLRDFPPGSPVQNFAETAHYDGFGSAHNLAINEATGFGYAIGSTTFAGGPHFVDLRTPGAPVAAGGWAADGYTHDAQCVVYVGPDLRYSGREICLLANEDTLTIIDVTDKGAVQQIARVGYGGSAYTHQVWFTIDQRHAFANDELDELSSDLRTRTLVWDLADLRVPVLVREYLHPAATIDHNNYVRDGFVYQSNYTAGLVVLDARDPLNPFEVGFFDSAAGSDMRSFDGTWSNYPFFASGLVVMSDMSAGLFVVRPQLPAGPDTDLRLTAELQRGGAAQITLTNAGAVVAEQVTVTVGADPVVTLESLTGTGAACEASADSQVTGPRAWRCRLVSLAPGASLSLELRFAGREGRVDIMASSARLDTLPADNRVRLDLADAPAGGGGGGAALGLLVLAGLAASRRRLWPLFAAVALTACAAAPVSAPLPELLNMRQVSAQLTTAGALREGEVGALKAAGVGLIVDLRTPEEGVEAERQAAEAAGLRWVNVPVGRSPTRAQLDALSAVLEQHRGVRTVVHCASNRRASAMVMLHQVTREGRDEAAARADLEAVWTPSGNWQEFIETTLREARR